MSTDVAGPAAATRPCSGSEQPSPSRFGLPTATALVVGSVIGTGVFGLPTVFKQASWSDYEETSNVHFFAVDRSLDIRPSGYLGANADAIDEDYECEVSCVDWYGNARPIFTEGRVFALMGTELVEGRLFNGGIAEIQRVGMTGAPRYRR